MSCNFKLSRREEDLMTGPPPSVERPGYCPHPKFSKTCLVVRCNKLQSFFFRNSTTTNYNNFSPISLLKLSSLKFIVEYGIESIFSNFRIALQIMLTTAVLLLGANDLSVVCRGVVGWERVPTPFFTRNVT